MKKRMFNIICSAVILISLLLTGTSSFADVITQDDIDKLENNLADIKKRQEETEKALAEIIKDKNYVESAIAYSEELINGYADYVILLSEIISEYEEAIDATEEKISDLKAKYEDVYKVYLQRLRMAREQNTYSVLELVFSSETLVDLIKAAERVTDSLDYDKRIIEKLEVKKEALSKELDSLEILKRNQEDQIEGYEALKDSVSERVDELNTQLAELQGKQDDTEKQIDIDEILEAEADKALEELIKAYEKQLAESAEYAQGEKMIWPLDDRWTYISSPFGYRIHPVYNVWKGHKGIDIPANKGENIYAALSGKVVTSVYSPSYGYYVMIDHGIFGNTGKRLYTLYAHSSKLLVEKGDMVKQGDIIAKVGSTGVSTGPHLHFEIRTDSTPTDPLDGYVTIPKKK